MKNWNRFFLALCITFSNSVWADPGDTIFDRTGMSIEHVTPADIGRRFTIPLEGRSIDVLLEKYMPLGEKSIPRFVKLSDNGPLPAAEGQGAGGSSSTSSTTAPIAGGSDKPRTGNSVDKSGLGSGSGFADGIGIGLVALGAGMAIDGSINASASAFHSLHDTLHNSLAAESAHTDQMSKGGKTNRDIGERSYVHGNASASAISKYLSSRTFFGPKSPLIYHPFSSDPTSVQGSYVRSLAYDYQEEWVRQRGFSSDSTKRELFRTGALLVDQSDFAFASGNDQSGYAYGQAARVTLDILRGFTDGVVETTSGIIKTIPAVGQALRDMAVAIKNDPNVVFTAAGKIYRAIPAVYDHVKADVIKNWNTIKNGSPYERSVLLGKAATQAAVIYFTAGIGETGEIVSATEELTSTAITEQYQQFLEGEAFKDVLSSSDVANKVDRFQNAVQSLKREGVQLSQDAHDFVGNQIAYENQILGIGKQFTPSQIQSMGRAAHDFEKILLKANATPIEETAYRGIVKNFWLRQEVAAQNTAESAAQYPIHSYYRSGRFSSVTETGEYSVLTNDAELAKRTIVAETNQSVDNLIITKTTIKMDRTLDLTDSKTRRLFGADHMKNIADPNSYLESQALGHMARRAGFEGIKMNSVQAPEATNVVRF